jgi:phage host-nuclease inhibitor protein Gam
MSVPAFLLNVDADERDELAALGVTAAPVDTDDQVSVKAHASRLLRAMGVVQRNIEELNALRQREYMQIDAVYEPQVERLQRRFQELQAWVCSLAEVADFGSKKSATLAFGTFGVRTVPESVSIIDHDAAVAWAEQEDLGITDVVMVKKLPHRKVAPLVIERIRAGGEVPPGIEYHAAATVPFAKPAKVLVSEER